MQMDIILSLEMHLAFVGLFMDLLIFIIIVSETKTYMILKCLAEMLLKRDCTK